MSVLDRVTLNVLHRLPPETAHHVALFALEKGLAGSCSPPNDPVLATRVWDLDFPNPIGLAAGFDKDARVADAMLHLGFGFVEAGTVTPKPQPGNAKPRLFRLDEDRAVINRFGFNSEGLEAFASRLAARKDRQGIIGANVGKNRVTEDAVTDYVLGIEKVAGLAHYLVVNISSPNTPGLRDLQKRAALEGILTRVLEARNRAVKTARKPPLLAKVGPDLDADQMRDIAEVALGVGIDGLIVGNTTVTRPDTLKSAQKGETGGLSGAPLMGLATQCLAEFYRLTKGRLPLIGCGGVASGRDAYAKIKAGASLVQLYSALVFRGPRLVRRINRELAQALKADGFSRLSDAVGRDHR
jgi:dihydroorotate dehydrogenase